MYGCRKYFKLDKRDWRRIKMNLISQIEEIKNKISGKILFDEKLSKYSWFNLGGPAKVVFKPKNLNELSIFLKGIKSFDKIKILGAGSNTLIRDGGFDGVIIKFEKSFSHISLFDSNTIIAGASTLDKTLSKFALENSLSGFEFLSCIPGTVGGGLRMNSGCYGEDFSEAQFIRAIHYWTIRGHQIGFYEHNPPDSICISDGHLEGFIILKKAHPHDLKSSTLAVTKRWTSFSQMKGAIISYRAGTQNLSWINEHELGHALGYAHVEEDGHIMHPQHHKMTGKFWIP